MSEENNKAEEIKKPVELPIQTKKFEQTSKVFSSFDETKHELTETISGPSDYNKNIPPRMEGVIFNNEDEAVADWGRTIAQGAETVAYDDQFIAPLKNENADFAQEVEVNGSKLSILPSRLKAVSNQELDGEKALMFVRNTFGLGSYIDVPLWHSGFWIKLKAPSDNEILELHRKITQDKIELGRATYGLAFSNQVVYFVSRLLEFALNNIHSSTIKTNKDIREFIYSHDIPILIWGIACAIWPNGFKYSRACVDNPGECNHVATEMISLHKLLWTNKTQLNEWQKSHMFSKAPASVSEEDVNRYRKELLNNQPQVVTIKKDDQDISFKLKVPTAEQWVSEGTSWINTIVEAVTTSFSETTNVAERNQHIIDRAKASSLQQYSHWVEEIELETNVIRKKEAVHNTLGALSSDDFIRDELIKAIKKYIDDTVISLIGIPSYNCPKCNKPQDSEETTLPNFVNIIPLDVYNTFFHPSRAARYQNQKSITHINDPEFGIETIKNTDGSIQRRYIDINTEIINLAEKLPKTPYMDIKMVLIDIYESYFGIYNHLDSSRTGDKTRPMASVALHECEDISSSSDLYKVIDNYFEKEVLKHTGYKLDEFLNLPREYTEIIFKKISEIQLKETKKANEVNNLLSAAAQRKN